MANDLISVVVPVYGVEQYLLRCIESIQKQTYKNLEIILVDDGSPDRCPQICEELAHADVRIKVIHKDNEGQGLARNTGLDAAAGTYVTFIDSDDWIGANHIENLYRAAQEACADMVIGGHTAVSANGEEQPHPIRIGEKVYTDDAVINEILLPMIGPDVGVAQDVQIESSSCMSLYRMEIISHHGLRFISERYSVAEDLHFNVDFLYYARRVVTVNETGYFYFENQSSTTRKYNPCRTQRTFNFYNTIVERLNGYGLAEAAQYRVERCYLMKVRVAIRLIVLSDLLRKQKLQEIRTILEHDITQSILTHHPMESYFFAMRLWLNLMRRKNALGIYHMVKLRETMRGKLLSQELLKFIGIGR